MPISLADYAGLIKDELALGLFQNLQRMNDVVKLFPMVDVGAPVVRGVQWDQLPSHGYRKLGGSYTASTGTTKPVEDTLAILGGSFSEDEALKQFTKSSLWRDPVQQQFDMHMKALDRKIAYDIINGDIDSDPDSFNGLYQRFDSGDFPSAQIIACGQTTDTLKVLASADNAKAWFKYLDQAMYKAGLWGANRVDGGAKGALLMNETTFLGMQEAAKLTGYVVQVENVLGWNFATYKGVPMVDMGLQRDKSTEIIGSTYDPGDGGNDGTRLFCVRFAQPDGNIESPGSDGLVLTTAGGFRKLGPIETLTSWEWGVEWILGMAHVGDDYCASLLHKFKMAAS